MGGYISTWGCLFWWSTRNTHNSAGLHYDFRKQVVMLTMSVYLKINKIHLWSLITYWIYIHGWHTEIQTVSAGPADLLLSDMYICVHTHTHTHINIGKSLRLKQTILLNIFCNNLVWQTFQLVHGFQISSCNLL